ncbi:GNAT family N-acetyltransferase [Pantoea sp. Tr-811]|uniref:GNAT family N-acetyltransferase n=1 Tax=unclassified Pantoea TaxID=2630326 RepID=UPI00141D9439|nr:MULTISPECIES: GNAT family N-acetyltransferase [unclassified Pantoea]NIE78498.1 GNAT family N-acetyltransferase [Pantoea sp. Ap-967]NIF29189.1 GNAT family N-acetyltransferase [Pantoea sp. Tr-811]
MLIDTLAIEGGQLRLYDDIADIDETLWNATLAFDHPFRSHRFMGVVQACYPQRTYRYLEVREHAQGPVVGLMFATEQDLDILEEAPTWAVRGARVVRCVLPRAGLLRVAMLGCFETAGQHWWVAPGHDERALFEVMVAGAQRALPRAQVHVVRDLETANAATEPLQALLRRRGFRACNNYPLALICLDGRGWPAHYARLKANSRKILKKAMATFEASAYSVVHYPGEVPGLEQLYRLYLNTHERATEYRREALPLAFFQQLQGSGMAVFSVLHDGDGQAVAFVLSGVGGKVINPFLFGRDYAVELPVNAYYVLHIDVLRQFASTCTGWVDLGITNYFVKQNLGSQLSASGLYLRLRNPVLNRIFGAYAASMFDIKQPSQRRVLRAEHGPEPAGAG